LKRRPREELKVEMNMTPMIDVVFQLLTFFMLTLKPMIHEGQFAVNMSVGGAAVPEAEEFKLPPLAVYVRATDDGNLAGILLGDRQIRGFDDLRIQVSSMVGGAIGEEIEAEIHADDALAYEHLVSAVNTLTAARISKINFAPGGK
jgi:biopolymer transport protein ExbD